MKDDQPVVPATVTLPEITIKAVVLRCSLRPSSLPPMLTLDYLPA
jgi:hypothetical protein